MMKVNFLKLGMAAIFMLSVSISYAQTTDPTSANVIKDTPADGTVVRVIDNKGTIKYFQTNNGITTITSTTPGSLTTTTWQLGGTLTDDTFIDVDGSVFGLDGIELETGTASTDATTESDHGTGTGYTLLVRDEVTGATKKLLVTDLIESGHEEYTALAADETGNSGTITATGMPATANVSVYRNGAKLRSGVDYTLALNVVTLVPNAADPNDWVVLTNDIFEVHWIK